MFYKYIEINMPYKTRRYKKYRKKLFGKKKKKFIPKYKTKTWILRMPRIMPDRVMVVMNYREFFNMTNVSGVGTQVFSMNSIFDPNVTGGGHQPLGHDQWANFYSNYEVKSSRITINILPLDTNVCRFSIFPSESSTSSGDSTAGAEQPYTLLY